MEFGHYVLTLRPSTDTMARVKVDIPEKFAFTATLKIRISDINYGGHLGNDSIVSLIHEARFQFYKTLGFKDELSIDGVGTIQADLVVNYKSEAFHGDEILVKIAVTEISRVSFDLTYQLLRVEDMKEVTRAKTTIVTYNYSEKTKVPIPPTLLERLEA